MSSEIERAIDVIERTVANYENWISSQDRRVLESEWRSRRVDDCTEVSSQNIVKYLVSLIRRDVTEDEMPHTGDKPKN